MIAPPPSAMRVGRPSGVGAEMAWDHRYRRLEEGEVILATDECLTDKDWHKDNGRCAGQRAPSPHYTSHRMYRRLKPVADTSPIWGKWYPHNDAPKGSYACLYQKGNAPVSLAWMPAQGRPNLPDAVVMPFRMPGDEGVL